VEELGIRLGEIDSYGSSCLVTHDAALERAFRRFCQAFVGADDASEEGAGGRARYFENALEGSDDILHAKLAAVGEFDAFADLEHLGLAAILGLRNLLGDVGDDLEAFGTCGLLECHKAIIGRLIELPVLQSVIDMGIKRPAGGAGEKTHRTTAMLGLV